MNIITHNGIFHADEVVAVALLKYHLEGVGEVIRTRDHELIRMASKTSYIIDVGGVYDNNNYMFDHHQDASLPCSAVLVWKWLKRGFYHGPKLNQFIDALSLADCGDKEFFKWAETIPEGVRTFVHLVSGFNRDPKDEQLQLAQFHKAVDFAMMVIKNEVYSSNEFELAKKEFNNSKRFIENGALVLEKFSHIWRELCDATYAIMPNPQGWQVLTRDSFTNPLPDTDSEDLIFLHKGRFIAIFKTQEAAISYGEKL